MKHRKQAMEQVERTIEWNSTRGNTPDTLDWKLEIDMLQEELDELKVAHLPVDRFDALLDLKFVLTGTLGKMGLSTEKIIDGYEAVLTANESKSATNHVCGKITKPLNFQEPEPILQLILDKP
jgi:predicted HAD superfamily Cof-like phosphohydrolase